MTDNLHSRLPLFPLTTCLVDNQLTIANCSLTDLAAEHGTPLYLFDRTTLDHAAAAYRDALAKHYPGAAAITYAGKAFLCLALAQWTQQQQLWLDCTGEGELHIAATAGVPRERILVHGVNKSDIDLDAALRHASVIVVDNFSELQRIVNRKQKTENGKRKTIWLRIRPGFAVDTHVYRQTGQSTSKFGMSAKEAARAVLLCEEAGLNLEGLHFHQGSHFHDPAPIGPALSTVLDLAAELRHRTGWTPRVLCPGGGWGVAYHEDDLPQPSVEAYVKFVAERVVEGCGERNLPLPRLQLEPGRSLIAQAGVALYRVGAVKQSGGRRWLLIDGGLADNPRPALYGSRYSALPVSQPEREPTGEAWLGGPYCESGDVLIEGLPLPDVQPGEMLAVPVSGAYHLAMGSNYNGARRPAVLWLKEGQARVIQRRETLAELVARDRMLQE